MKGFHRIPAVLTRRCDLSGGGFGQWWVGVGFHPPYDAVMTNPANQSFTNVAFVEEMYERYRRDPRSVPEAWHERFANGEFQDAGETAWQSGPATIPPSLFAPPVPVVEARQVSALQDKVDQLVRAFRFRGHAIAQLDPLGSARPPVRELELSHYGFTAADVEREFSVEGVGPSDRPTMRLGEIHRNLRNTYCRTIGVEYMHIDEVEVRRWLQSRMEHTENRLTLSRETQLRILTRLTDASVFEEFIRKKFIGAKSFSLEGSESLIPLLDLAIEKAAEMGVVEIDLGMAHRGRLNVLANIMGKHPKVIFREFADAEPEKYRGAGDVKYHLGHSKKFKTASGRQVHISLSFNPSHLEFVNPVVLGRARANSDRLNDPDRRKAMALLIHGDAAFAGQGVSQEILNLSQLPGYRVGGTLHIITNNQISFTTGPDEGRSTMYCTDVCKMLPIPIFHVNGEDPEAVAQVVSLAMEFRQEFQRDVVIDMYGYRKLGHNEADEPSFTQPQLYRAIEMRKPVREGYVDYLLKLGGIRREESDQIAEERRQFLNDALNQSRAGTYKLPTDAVSGVWAQYQGGADAAVADGVPAVEIERLQLLLTKTCEVPPGFTLHPKLAKILEARRAMADGHQPLDWAAAETLAYATLVTDGFRVRLSGQDAGRGTFSHRHALLTDYENGQRYMPLRHLAPGQAPIDIINSPLSEVAVLGFEYGYSLEYPDGLVAWEAQFGDFCNVAQVIIDQFIISAEDKWRRLSGVTLLLPHAFEGQGPEHSSARLERFLNICAQDNIQVVYPTTPAQMYHLLRRQVHRKLRKPLVVMTPKSLLRHPKVVSSRLELSTGGWQRVIGDTTVAPAGVRRVLMCTGKIYYDLEARREQLQRQDTAILRLEQLYPLSLPLLQQELDRYAPGIPVTWVQEEPENMGAWRFFRLRVADRILRDRVVQSVCRPESASPATGSANNHKQEQEQLLLSAFASLPTT